MSTIAPHTRNVTRLFRQASPKDVTAGRDWYARASRLAGELAESLPVDHLHHGDVSRAAAVIAVLSPQTSWSRNVQLARQAYAAAGAGHHHVAIVTTLGCLKTNASKAARLLTTDEPTDAIVSGPKVTAFWRTIADPTDPRAVVVDRHAIDVTLNRVTDDATRGKVLGKRGAYESVSACYVRAARILSAELCRECNGTALVGWSAGQTVHACEACNGSGRPFAGITPAEVQAVTWTTWRRIAAPGHGRKAGTDRRRTGQAQSKGVDVVS